VNAAGRVPRVLVAEDDPDIGAPLVRALQREGYEVAHVVDGASALAGALGGSADLLVLDLGLPGMDGLDVCRAIKSRRPETHVVMLSARGQTTDREMAAEAGADGYVVKPVEEKELHAAVRAGLPDLGAA